MSQFSFSSPETDKLKLIEQLASLLSIVSCVFVTAQVMHGLSDNKTFSFLAAEVYFVTAIAYATQIPFFPKYRLAPIWTVSWFTVATLQMVKLTWPSLA